MRTRHHGQISQLVSKFPETLEHLVEHWQHRSVAGGLQHQRMREIVDVFRSTSEMDEFGNPHHFRIGSQALPDPVLQGLDVMIGHRFDRFHFSGVQRAEFGKQSVHFGQRCWRESRNLGKMRLGRQGLEPLDLDL